MRMIYNKAIFILFIWFLATPALALDNAVETGLFSSTAISGYDPVAYFTDGQAVEGDKQFEYEWRGATWRFNNAENLETFKNNPVQFAPQYGGWCAYGMSGGKTVRVDPEAWHIHDEKLYLNYSKSVQKTWLQDKESNIVEANHFYPKITDINEWLEKEANPAG